MGILSPLFIFFFIQHHYPKQFANLIFFSHKIRDLDKITESFYRMNSSVRIILQLYLALAPAEE